MSGPQTIKNPFGLNIASNSSPQQEVDVSINDPFTELNNF
jgi:hypothetical protein